MDQEEYTPEVMSQSEGAKESQVVYCGPNVPSKGMFTYQVYLGGLPANVKEMIAEIPEVERLLVKVGDLDEFRRRLGMKGTIESLWYERVLGKVRR